MHLAAGISTACLLPLLLIELTQLSRLSMLGSTSTLLVIAMVLALLGLDPSRQAMPQQVRGAEGVGRAWGERSLATSVGFCDRASRCV